MSESAPENRVEKPWKPFLELLPAQGNATLRPFLPDMDDSRFSQDFEMVRRRRLGHGQIDAPARRLALARELLDDLQAYGIGKCIKYRWKLKRLRVWMK